MLLIIGNGFGFFYCGGKLYRKGKEVLLKNRVLVYIIVSGIQFFCNNDYHIVD